MVSRCVCVYFLGTKPNADDEIKRYKPKIFNVFELSTDNMRVCAKALYFIHAPALTHTKHHRMIKINYIINLIIGPNESVRVCVFIFDFFVVVHTKLKAFYAWMGCVFLCVCVYVFFAVFRSPQANTSKVRDCCFPKSFGQHLLDPTYIPSYTLIVDITSGWRTHQARIFLTR